MFEPVPFAVVFHKQLLPIQNDPGKSQHSDSRLSVCIYCTSARRRFSFSRSLSCPPESRIQRLRVARNTYRALAVCPPPGADNAGYAAFGFEGYAGHSILLCDIIEHAVGTHAPRRHFAYYTTAGRASVDHCRSEESRLKPVSKGDRRPHAQSPGKAAKEGLAFGPVIDTPLSGNGRDPAGLLDTCLLVAGATFCIASLPVFKPVFCCALRKSVHFDCSLYPFTKAVGWHWWLRLCHSITPNESRVEKTNGDLQPMQSSVVVASLISVVTKFGFGEVCCDSEFEISIVYLVMYPAPGLRTKWLNSWTLKQPQKRESVDIWRSALIEENPSLVRIFPMYPAKIVTLPVQS
jgi:hypothetical protein